MSGSTNEMKRDLDFALQVEHLRVAFKVGDSVVHAVSDASMQIDTGGAVGLVGESGSGKSTFARAVLRLFSAEPHEIAADKFVVCGHALDLSDAQAVRKLRGGTVAMVFQDPLTYLNPLMKIGSQIREAIALHDRAADRGKRVGELLELVKLPQRVAASYPHELSGGMRQRALLAVALACKPKLLIADEPTTALDVTTQSEILLLLRDIRRELGMALLLISHDLGTIATLCDDVYVMYGGRTIERATRSDIFHDPIHPYTRSLLAAAVAAQDENGRFVTLGGDSVGDSSTASGCGFASRCAQRMPRCEAAPALSPIAADMSHSVRCWLATPEPGKQDAPPHPTSLAGAAKRLADVPAG
jgi:oligopeptide/dipeptide ABC transporter ATP-binding protein